MGRTIRVEESVAIALPPAEVWSAIAENPEAVEKIKAGKGQAIGAIVGAVMRETRGRADGGEVQRMITERIGA